VDDCWRRETWGLFETLSTSKVAAKLTEMANVVSAKIDERNLEIELEVRDPNVFYASLSTLVLQDQMSILSFSSPDNNLESVFQYLVEG
jgi:hypothetical protein